MRDRRSPAEEGTECSPVLAASPSDLQLLLFESQWWFAKSTKTISSNASMFTKVFVIFIFNKGENILYEQFFND